MSDYKILYQVVEGDNYEIESKVEKAIYDGWTLSGGVCVSGDQYYQAMIFDRSKNFKTGQPETTGD